MVILTTLPSASADDPVAMIRLLAAQDAALADVGERLAIAALPLCRDRGWAPGMVVQTRVQYGPAYRDVATRVLLLGDAATVTHVRPGGAAARAGLVAGDVVTAIDSVPIAASRSERAAATMAATEAALDALDAGLADGVADLRVLRGGQPRDVRLRGTPACRARFEVRPGSDTNASATRDRVQVSSDLIDPARAEQDLAPLVAHELAHVILRHEDSLRGKWGGLLPGFGKHGAAIRASEIAADRLSVYLLALAGYRPGDAVTFQTDFGRRNGAGILSDRTHPEWRERVAAIRVEIARIGGLVAAGQPVRPPADLLPSG